MKRKMAKTRGAITPAEVAKLVEQPAIETHPCRRCTRPIDDRYPFRVCVRCSLDELQASLETDGYYELRKQKAYERLQAAGLLRKEE